MRQELEHSTGRRYRWESGVVGATRKVLAATITLDPEGPIYHAYDAGGANRDVILPALRKGLFFVVGNIGTTGSLVVKDSLGTVIAEVVPKALVQFYATDLEWREVGAVFGPVGAGHSTGLVPDPGPTPSGTRFLRDDGVWVDPGFQGDDAFTHITDGTNVADAAGADTFKLRSANGILSILVTNDQPIHGDNALFTVNQGAIDHNALLNYVANEHIDHSTVSIVAGAGLSGGGNITASRTIDLDLSDLAVDTPVLADTFAFFDVSGGDTNKATLTALNAILDHNALINYVANQHVDHTAVSIIAGNGLSGGGNIAASRTIDLDLNELTTDTPVLGDFVPFVDISQGNESNKATWSTVNGILDHDALVNFIANEHIDHSTVSISPGRGMSGGGNITATRTLDRTAVVNAQTGTTYTYVDGDGGKLVTHSNASAIAGTLPQAGSGGNFASGWFLDVENRGAGTLTITPTTSTIDGAANVALTTNQGCRIFSDGTNYFTQRGVGGGSEGAASMTRRTITSADTAGTSDKGNIIEATSGTFTLAFTAAATLGNGWWSIIFNSGTGDVTLDPNSSEQIDSLTSWILYPGGAILVTCNGSAFESVLLSPMRKQFDSNGTFTKPGVGIEAELEAYGGGASGGKSANQGGGGGAGGAYATRTVPLSSLGATETITIGAGGASQTTSNSPGNVGGNTTIGSLLTGFGGGAGGGAITVSNPGGGGGGLTGAGATGTGGGDPGNGGTPRLSLLDNSGTTTTVMGAASSGATFSNGNIDGGGGGGIGDGAGAPAVRGGGGGGGSSSSGTTGGAGGASIYGGAGGGGGGSSTGGAGGTSLYGANGGAGASGANNATAGSAPGGGGGGSKTGNSGAGAGGRAIITVR